MQHKAGTIDYPDGITAIDTEYVRPMMDASHLIVNQGRAAFVDTGTSRSVPLLLEALTSRGLAPEDVEYVLVTHVHLDHAGGAGELMAALPRATAVLHPRGARHMADPARLIEGSIQVYGEELFRSLYGRIRPIPEDRIRTVRDGDTLELSGRTLEFLHTEGHARHHYCILDHGSRCIFAGDSFGLSYRELDTDKGEFIFPSTTPVQFDPEAAVATVDRLMAAEPAAIYLTHYSRVLDLPRLAGDLKTDIRAYADIALDAGEATDGALEEALRQYMYARLDAHGCDGDPHWRESIVGDDIRLNAQGLAVWLARRANSP
ncbi:MAG: MBL fold metallo-hydrolase [Gammaproteobacteria bacterium SG8_31]|jgi:glyoxylase-like metal-dependent hydrolase (beta-lactamase superfamily II)|nr:MAG: MBL fold metallo-hydrolase [Gammaproteobacteria bacterium SG8_31]